jgi:ATP-binding cassette subfamily C protein CydC
MKAMLRILLLWRSSAGWLLAGLVVSVLSLFVGIALLTEAGQAVARGWSGPSTSGLVWFAVAVPTIWLLRWLGIGRVVIRYLERLLTHEATFRALARLRVWFFRGFAARSAGGLGFRRAGDAMARLVDDIEALDGLYLRILVPLLSAALLLPFLFFLFAVQNLVLAVKVSALFCIAAFVLPAVAARGTFAGGRAVTQANAGLRIAALDALGGLREVRAFGAEPRMLDTLRRCQDALLEAQAVLARRGAWANAGAFLCAQLALLAVLAAADSPGQGLAEIPLLFLTVAAFDLVFLLPRAGALSGHAAEAAERVLAAAGPLPRRAAAPAVSTTMPVGSSLCFEAVGFRWQADRPPVFEGLTLEIPQGARVAVLGPSGSGKSTLAALALKVAAPESGRVLFGGVDIATLDDTVLRSRIGWLSQATHLFNDSIRNNLTLARPDADDAALWAALEAAQIAETVRELPDGLDTWVGEAGRGFSGGQGRRLVLARALLSRAPLLIFDEPCTGLDTDTERAFLSTLNSVAEGRSIMLIAHRLIGVERLDRIWRLSGGRAVAAMA